MTVRANDDVRMINGRRTPDPEAEGTWHTQLGTRNSRSQPGTSYKRAVEFDENGNPIREIHFTDHGMPNEHTNPHQHEFDPKTGKKHSAIPLPPKPDPHPYIKNSGDPATPLGSEQ